MPGHEPLFINDHYFYFRDHFHSERSKPRGRIFGEHRLLGGDFTVSTDYQNPFDPSTSVKERIGKINYLTE